MAYSATTVSAATTLTQATAYSAEETAGAAAVIYLRDTSDSGTILARIKLNAYASETVGFGENPIGVALGKSIYIHISSGTAAVTLHGR